MYSKSRESAADSFNPQRHRQQAARASASVFDSDALARKRLSTLEVTKGIVFVQGNHAIRIGLRLIFVSTALAG